jgi:TPR repeat protein
MQGCDKDDPGCMIEMAKHLESGTYVKEDPARAMGLYRKLSETDDAKAIGFANLGRFHEEGITVKRDIRKARMYYREAAKDRNAFAMYRLYELTKKSGTKDEMVFWLISAAEEGSVPAMVDLAARYENGDGVPRSRRQAIEWYHRASDKGNKDSRDNIAQLLLMEDFEDEPTMYEAAIEKAAVNDRETLMLLARFRFLGEGVRKSERIAKRWYELAALYGVFGAENGMELMSGIAGPAEEEYEVIA